MFRQAVRPAGHRALLIEGAAGIHLNKLDRGVGAGTL